MTEEFTPPPTRQERDAFASFGKRNKAPPVVTHTSESALVNAAIRWLYAHNVFCYRQNSGAYKPEGGTRFIRYGYPGAPDIVAIHNGAYIGIELKTDKGRQSDNQIAFQQKLEAAGGKYFIIRSVDDLEQFVKPLVTRPS